MARLSLVDAVIKAVEADNGGRLAPSTLEFIATTIAGASERRDAAIAGQQAVEALTAAEVGA